MNKFELGDSVLIPVMQDEHVRVKYLCVICLRVWKEQLNSEEQIKEIVLAALDKIKEKKVRDLSFSPLDDGLLGVPSDIAAKALCRTLFSTEYFENMRICTKDEQNLERVSLEYERKTKIKLEKGDNSTMKSASEKEVSVYF